MLRLATLSWMAVAIAVGLLLYNVKLEVQGLEQKLARINRAIHATQERIHVLEAEWSLLNEPERLRDLASRHLDLVPMRPSQFAEPAVIAALPLAVPHAEREIAKAPAEARPQPAPARASAPAAAPGAPPRQAETRRDPRPGEPPARLGPQREEPLTTPRQAAPQPRRELEAGPPRPLLPGPGPAALAVPVAAPAQPPARAQVSANGSLLGTPPPALPPPVPVQR